MHHRCVQRRKGLDVTRSLRFHPYIECFNFLGDVIHRFIVSLIFGGDHAVFGIDEAVYYSLQFFGQADFFLIGGPVDRNASAEEAGDPIRFLGDDFLQFGLINAGFSITVDRNTQRTNKIVFLCFVRVGGICFLD